MTDLAPWKNLRESERQEILAALQRAADVEGEAVKWSGVDRLSKEPVIEILAALPRDGGLLILYLYDFRIGRLAQSGSDWDEHHVHVGRARWRDGVVLPESLARHLQTVIEYDCPSYDEAREVDRRRSEAVAALNDAQGSGMS